MNFCTRCGQPRTGGTRFCTSCGAPFPTAAAPPAGPGASQPRSTASAPSPGPPPGPAAPPPGPAAPGADQTAADEPFEWLFKPQASEPARQYSDFSARGRPYGQEDAPPTAPVPAQFGTGQPTYHGPGPPYHEQYPGSYRKAPQRNRGRTVTIVAGVIIVLVAGGVGAWAALGGKGHPGAQPTHHPASTATHASPQPSTSAPSSSPAPSPSSSLVSVAPGVGQQGSERAVVAFLNRYFTAINQHNYPMYHSLLDAQQQQGITEAQFRSGYRSTRDSAATLVSLAPGGGGTLAASITFTSHQPASISPSHSACTDWSTTLFLRPQSGSYVIGAPPSSYRATYHAC